MTTKYRPTRANTSDGRQVITAPSLAAAGVPADLATIALELKAQYGALRFGVQTRSAAVLAWQRERGVWSDALAERSADGGAVFVTVDGHGSTATTRGCVYLSIVLVEK